MNLPPSSEAGGGAAVDSAPNGLPPSPEAGGDITAAMLRGWPLPMPDGGADKEERGHVLVIAGAREMPGAVLLAAGAALRAGAGKLTVATAASVAPLIGMALPEARVIGLAETEDGGLLVDARGALCKACGQASAVLIGPGMQDDSAAAALVRALLPECLHVPVILDAAAMAVVRTPAFRFASRVLLTPHAGELAGLSAADKQDIVANPEQSAQAAARRWQATVALKGALTAIAAPDDRLWRHRGGNTGLAISGSGDVLAGVIAGLAARGAPLEQAAAWGVALHAMAGEQLSLKHGPLGYLARELSSEVPPLLRVLDNF